jgi:hypothetical protein
VLLVFFWLGESVFFFVFISSNYLINLPIIIHRSFNKFRYKLFDLIEIAQYSNTPEKKSQNRQKRNLFLSLDEGS